MYTKDLVRRVTVRLDDKLSQFITSASQLTGQTPSEWVRMVLHSYMVSVSSFESGLTAILDTAFPQPNQASTAKAANHEDKKSH